MKWTKQKPTTPGMYWFKRAGRRERTPEVAKVYRKGKHLYFHTGTWDGVDFADDNPMDGTSEQHRWSDEPIPVPTA